jgi:cellulose synthase/poly-beta-1,6-N-acetylglucosamine synthase-like glycosyltransferase
MTLALALLIAGTAAAFYILIGYPILLAWLGERPKRPPVRKDLSYHPAVSVILAVHNGEQFLRQKLDCLLGLNYPGAREILVVSDGSTDATDLIAAEYSHRGVKLLRQPRSGKSAGLNLALEHATAEILFFTDVRQLFDQDALLHLAANFADPSIGAVTGELRLFEGGSQEDANFGLYWRYELWARRQHSNIDSIFNVTGCVYAARRELVEPIPPDTLGDDAVIPLRIFFRGSRIIFEPDALAFDYPTAAGGEFRRKLRTLGGLCQVGVRMPQLFSSADRMRFHFLSHKFGRLVLPWAILLIWGATIAMAKSPSGRFELWGEIALVLLALVDRAVPSRFPLKRLTSPARTFLQMNAAAFCAPAVFFVSPNRLWRPTKVKMIPDPPPAESAPVRASEAES